MSAVVAQRTSPHMPRPASRNNSPMDNKSNAIKSEEKAKESPSSRKPDTKSPPKADPPASIKQPPDTAKDAKPASNAEGAQPLAPPPRPAQQNGDSDYFSKQHTSSHYSLEPNLFEQSFGNPSEETPGKSVLPPIGSLTSPGNSNLGASFSWAGSLRSGPLSPAMLSGPTGAGDYFDTHLKGSFPTPNESSLRTGLTPGGGGSMFPAPSPNSQAFINSLASGGATPSTLEFHRTAAAAAAANRSEFGNSSTSQSQPARNTSTTMDPVAQQATTHQHFGQHDNDAANGLFLLAQAGNESQSNQFAVPNQPAHTSGQDASAKRPSRNNAGSIGGSVSGSARGQSEMSAEDDKEKPNTRKSKRASAGKSNGARRKADETPVKQPASKKAKTVTSPTFDSSMDHDDSDDDMGKDDEEEHHESGKKMTDEEKRKNFLERNRVAALKCRQRKKQWLANLQQKVEIFSTENDALSAQVNSLREEILNLKTILIAHKDCPITLAHNQQAPYLHNNSGEYANHNIPYTMAMQPGQQVMAGPRRFS